MSRMPKEFDEFGLTDCFIAGGSILSTATKTKINDYDVYPKSKEAFINAIANLMDDQNCFVINVSDRAITFKSNTVTNWDGERMIVQVMSFDVFPTAQHIFNAFDFTVCMAAYDCDTKEYIFHEDFYPDIASKTLRFNPNTKYPLNSFIRVSKYQTKGYYISKMELAKIALCVAKTGFPNSWEELENQIGGSYGRTLTLAREGIEFNFENAIEILSNTTFEITEDLTENLSDIKSDSVINCYRDDDIEYISTMTDKKYYYIVKDNYFIEAKFSKDIYDIIGPKPNYKQKSIGKIFGYNTEKGSQSYSFSSGKEFITDKTKIRNHSSENKIVLMSADVDKIERIMGNIIYGNTKKECFVTVDTPRIDDVNDIVFNALTKVDV